MARVGGNLHQEKCQFNLETHVIAFYGRNDNGDLGSRRNSLNLLGNSGGQYGVRTCDPRRVKAVLYR